MTEPLNILWMYPDLLNLHGDRGNAMALMRVSEQAGVLASITRVDRLGDPVPLDDADVLLFGSGELVVMPSVIAALTPLRAKLEQMVDAGVPMLVTGTSAALIARQTTRLDGTSFAGLGLLAADVTERAKIYGDDLIVKSDQEYGGFQIRMTNLILDQEQTPFAQVVYGLGNDQSHVGVEGARRGNLIATGLLGPALVKNPWLAWSLISAALRRQGRDVAAPDETAWARERQSAAAIRQFNATKQLPPGVVRDM